MKAFETKIKKIMKAEQCDREKAIRFFELSQMLTSDDFTSELGKQIYIELNMLRAK